jgi:hypothetical protein
MEQVSNGHSTGWVGIASGVAGLVGLEGALYPSLMPRGEGGVNVTPTRNFAGNGEPDFLVNWGQQNKHVVGTNEYKTAGQVTQRSPLAPGINPQILVNRYAGTGQAANNVPLGYPGSVERVTTAEVVGTY